MTRTRLAGIIVALLLPLLACCSAIKLGYNTLPELAYWWLDGYVDFHDAQRAFVRDELARVHAWHRVNELPRIAEVLRRMEQAAPGPVTPAQVCAFVAEVQVRANALADRAEGPVVQVAMGLDGKQLRHIERKFRSKNDEWRRDWVDKPPAEMRDKRLEQAVDRAEMIYGALEEPQRAVLRQAIDASRFDPARVLAERERRQQDLFVTLRRASEPDAGQAAARALMRGFLDRAQMPSDPASGRLQQEMLDESCRTTAALHNATSTAQREQAVRRLRAYQRDLAELAARK